MCVHCYRLHLTLERQDVKEVLCCMLIALHHWSRPQQRFIKNRKIFKHSITICKREVITKHYVKLNKDTTTWTTKVSNAIKKLEEAGSVG